jgi:hypothetical protein
VLSLYDVAVCRRRQHVNTSNTSSSTSVVIGRRSDDVPWTVCVLRVCVLCLVCTPYATLRVVIGGMAPHTSEYHICPPRLGKYLDLICVLARGWVIGHAAIGVVYA